MSWTTTRTLRKRLLPAVVLCLAGSALPAASDKGGMQFEEGAGTVTSLAGTRVVVGGAARDSAAKGAPSQSARAKARATTPQPTLSMPFHRPIVPDFGHVPAGQFSAAHDPFARRYIETGGNGALVTCSVPLPEPTNADPNLDVLVFVKIYDVAGNLVCTSDRSDVSTAKRVISSPAAKGGRYDIDVYWNGSNSNGMPVAPGVYKAFVYLDYSSPFLEDRLLTSNIRVGR